MKHIMKIVTEKEVEIKYLKIKAGVRYWEDATVNGVDDEDGSLIPFKNGKMWEPTIDIDQGVVIHWPIGTTARIHYKVCDDGSYYLLTESGSIVLSIEEYYVPEIACPEERGYGDYIIMNVDESGKISNWPSNPCIEDFLPQED